MYCPTRGLTPGLTILRRVVVQIYDGKKKEGISGTFDQLGINSRLDSTIVERGILSWTFKCPKRDKFKVALEALSWASKDWSESSQYILYNFT